MATAHHILVVDDDPVFLAVAESVVLSLGDHTVTTACDGVEGLAALRAARHPIDVIVLDLNMPKMDGLAYLRSLGEQGYGGAVLLSSGESEAILDAARRMGEMLGVHICGSLKKPIRTADFVALLETCEARSQTQKPARGPASGAASTTARGTLLPYYQPQVDLVSLEVTGLEALIRLDTVGGEILGPQAVFHPGLREADLPPLTIEIATRVMDDIAAWRAKGVTRRVSINLDARIIEVPHVMPALFGLAAERDLAPSGITFELTETALPSSMTDMIEILTRARMAGFGVSIDDYGTGSANFALLRLCPFSELKVDRSIVQACVHDRISRRFLENTAITAKDLGMAVVAEGVETSEELAIVREAGIHIVQGYLYSKPLPAADAFVLTDFAHASRRFGSA
ncbi:putative two-component response regulator [Aurantimonas manganoxydans SI85-9A1]|uniref:Putative two-component response regulator n=2 Tax=Aurantimonas manganoxydans TaxID=651183 RepID=Q1YHP6_AURMS|nr:EAL domain-containing response regulator [Aurantimonas manganoxydans]EAS49533.1 putative two-component response regulator [Aurantimonas manganoxydans SI85-9A1]BAT29112.1 putative two-component response regulator [Aurantimonas manganoxydans SI85-9A1]